MPGPRRGRALRLRLATATVIAAGALLVAGCGGGGGATTDATSGLTPSQIVTQSEAKAKDVTSYTLGLDAKLTSRLAARGGGGAVGLLRQPISAKGEGPVKVPDQASLDLAATVGQLPVQVNLTTTGGRLYLTVLGQVLEPNVPAKVVGQVDLGAIRSGLLGWMSHPREVGREQLDGVGVVRLKGGVDAAAASADVASALGAIGAVTGGGSGANAAAVRQLRAALKGGELEAWIGTDDLQVRREHAVVRLAGRVSLLPGVRALTLDVTGTFTKLNQPVTITAPAGARKVDLSSLLSQLGG